jgi:hypothetical protein
MKRLFSTFLVAVVAIVAVHCGDRSAIAPDESVLGLTPLKGMVISNPQPASASVATVEHASVNAGGNEEIAYVSLAPKTLPNAVEMQIENRTRNLPASLVAVIGGGFDPVPIEASVGDTLELTAWMADGSKQPMSVRVPAKRPPSVVRSKPGTGLTDVALNVVVTVVFTEPIDTSTVNLSSVQLLHGEQSVSGKIVFQGDSWDALFVPDKPLDPESTYELVVTREVRDLDGQALDASYSSTFVTGTKSCSDAADKSGCPPPASVANNVVTGIVTERTPDGVRPMPLAVISAWVQLSDGSGYSPPNVYADADGKYTIDSLPHATIQLHALVFGMDQPCGVAVQLSNASAIGNIEVVSTRNPLPDSATALPRISGWVFEAIPLPTVMLPGIGYATAEAVPGARVYFESPGDFVAATTTADSEGNYALCNLPPSSQPTIYSAKPGFTMSKQTLPVTLYDFENINNSIELKR